MNDNNILEIFEEKHRELEQAAKNFEFNEEKRYEREQELLDDMKDIASESKRVAGVARNVSRTIKVLTFVLTILEIFLLVATKYFVTDKLLSSIFKFAFIVLLIFIIRFVWKLRSEIFDKSRKKIKG